MTRLLPYILILLVCSCATRKERRCHRAAKKVEKASELCPKAFVRDTIDTTITILVPGDTVYLPETLLVAGDTVWMQDTSGVEVGLYRPRTGNPCDSVPVAVTGEVRTPDKEVKDDVKLEQDPCPDMDKLNPGVAPWYRTAFWVLAVLIVVAMGITAILRR